MHALSLLAFALSLATSNAVYQGFNYGSTQTDGSFKQQSDFQNEFKTAKSLVGASGFTSARLYTMLQGGANSPTSAIPAAIAEKTTLLLGLWASGGDAGFQSEMAALTRAIKQYKDPFTSLVVGISVGSEDLYRNSVMGIQSKAGIGADPSVIANYIGQVRSAIAGTALAHVPVGHVDTWTAWVNSSNNAVTKNCDFIGVDAYPYFQSTMSNAISSGRSLFESAIQQTQAAVGSKPIWITETGWPVSGSTSNLAVPSPANAKTYWDEVGCPLFGKVNTWWFTLQDADPTTPNPSFGIIGSSLTTNSLFDLTCPKGSSTSTLDLSASVATAAPNSTSGSSGTATSPTNLTSTTAPTSSTGSSAGSSAGSSPGASPDSSPDSSTGSSPGSSSGSSTSNIAPAPASATGTSGSGTSGSSSGSGSSPSSSSSGSTSQPTNAASAAKSGPIFGAVAAVAAVVALL